MEPIYKSTRSKNIQASPKQAVLKGIAQDGGLFVFDDLDQIQIDLNKICSQSYLENAQYILSGLLPDYTQEELKECVENAYGNSFASDAVTPLVKVGDQYVLELFHGPTSAFKDVALTLLPQLMSQALKDTDEKALILTATSGDTGKAALSGFQDVKNTGICVFYPNGKVSNIQYRQMACQQGSNVHVYAVEGNFGDAQSMVKKLFLDKELNEFAAKNKVRLSSANSINIGRLVPQIVYYFEAYKQLVKDGVIQIGDEVSFSVPTGNFGDVLAGYYASLMGLPVKKFYVASNSNSVLSDFFETGTYDRNRPFVQTISPSMDILISSNLERLLYYMSGKDADQVAAWMKDLSQKGVYSVGDEMKKKLQETFGWGYFDDAATKEIIAEVYDKTGYVLDPHSAIGYGLGKEADGVVVTLATASPYKFSRDVLSALKEEEKDEWKALHRIEELSKTRAPKALADLETAEILHTDILQPEEMKEAVMTVTGEMK